MKKSNLTEYNFDKSHVTKTLVDNIVMMNVIRIYKNNSNYPGVLNLYLNNTAPEVIAVIGNLSILKNKRLGVLSSVKCPGAIILKTYDLMRDLRAKGVAVISGFHSPMEQECLNILLRGKQSVIVCRARSIEGMRLRGEYKQPLADGRLLLLSPFDARQPRITVENAIIRNRFVAVLADAAFVAYAEPGGKTEQFCREIASWGKRIYTFEDGANANLLELGAKSIHSYNHDSFSKQ